MAVVVAQTDFHSRSAAPRRVRPRPGRSPVSIAVAGVLAVTIMLRTTAAFAAAPHCLGRTCFDAALRVGGRDLLLRGTSSFRYLFIDLYVGALYLEPSVTGNDDPLGPSPKSLVLEYRYAISRDDLAESTRELVVKNPQVDMRRIRAGLDRICDLYRDVEPGDRYHLSYDPASGTSLFLNGALLGTIPGDELARALFGIWISPYSVDREFTSKLLGK